MVTLNWFPNLNGARQIDGTLVKVVSGHAEAHYDARRRRTREGAAPSASDGVRRECAE